MILITTQVDVCFKIMWSYQWCSEMWFSSAWYI